MNGKKLLLSSSTFSCSTLDYIDWIVMCKYIAIICNWKGLVSPVNGTTVCCFRGELVVEVVDPPSQYT